MSSDAYERAARESPELAPLIERIASFLARTSSVGAPLRQEHLATMLGEDLTQVQTACTLLHGVGAVSVDYLVECEHCSMLNTHESLDSEEQLCSSCTHPIAVGREVTVFRLVEIRPRPPRTPATEQMKGVSMNEFQDMVLCRQSDEHPFLYPCATIGGQTLQHIEAKVRTHGLCVIRQSAQTPEEAILHSIAKHFGVPSASQNDFHGEIKTIQPKEEGAKNSGDTTADLGLHVDGTQHAKHPPILMFQYLDEPSYGGESNFVDGAAVLHDLDPDERRSLVLAMAGPAAVAFAKKGLSYTGPSFWSTELESLGFRVAFNEVMKPQPGLEGVVSRLQGLYTRPQYKISFKPQEGDIAIFDNWRYLHARDEVFGHRVRRHRRMWIEGIFGYRAKTLRLGIRVGAELQAAVIAA